MKSILQLLAAYDEELRTDAETPSAIDVRTLGPLRLVKFARGRGFVTYRDLAGADAAEIRRLVAGALDHYRADQTITKVEWKTRGHDKTPGLRRALLDHGFVEGETESIMIGEAQLLVTGTSLPPGVVLRTIHSDQEIIRMSQMQADVFDDIDTESFAAALSERLARKDGMELWVAEYDGQIVCSGRLEPVKGTAFAGIWGGATRAEWRGRGIYRALTAARAESALSAGKKWLHSDSTEFSRPILERAGLVKVSTTTPFTWAKPFK